MFTGRFSHELSVIRAKFSPDGLTALDSAYPTLAEALSASGYLSAGFVANTEYCGYETGLNRGFAHYEDYQLSPVELALSSSVGRTVLNYWRLRRIFDYYDIAGRKTAQEVNNSFLRWLDRRRVQPFFAFLNYYDAHEPYRPPPPFDAQFGPNAPRENYPAVFGEGGIRQVKRGSRQLMSAPEIQAELDAYEGAIAYIDHHLGLLFDELQRRGLLENTLVIVTADHGEQFGEHGLFDHGNSLYLPLLHVPLVISFPTYVPAGAKISEPVSLRDLPATVLGLVGLGRVVSFPGASLARYWDDAPESKRSGSGPVFSEVTPFAGVPRRYPIARGDMSALVLDHYHYIKNGDGREELYDFAVDPAESHNLANSEESRQLLEQFRTRLKTTLAGNQLSSR
jgi:arylsulfatase A-like enzyme